MGTNRRAMVIIMANSWTGTWSLVRGFSSRSMASVSWVGEVVKVRMEVARIRMTMRTVTKMLLRMPFRVMRKMPNCTRGSPLP